MANKISVSSNAFEAFENEIKLSLENKKRTLDDVSNKEVLLLLNNPGCEIEVKDIETKKIIGTVAAGLGSAGFAAAATGGTVVAGGVAAGGVALSFKAAAASATVPGVGWIIAGGILAITAVAATGIAIASNADKKKAEEKFNQKQKLYQEQIKKLIEEIRQLKKDNMEFSKRYQYLLSILNAIQPQGSMVTS